MGLIIGYFDLIIVLALVSLLGGLLTMFIVGISNKTKPSVTQTKNNSALWFAAIFALILIVVSLSGH